MVVLFLLVLLIAYAIQASLLLFLFWLLIDLVARYAGFRFIPREGRWPWSAIIGMATAPYGALDVGHAPVFIPMGIRLMLSLSGRAQDYCFSDVFVWITFSVIFMIFSYRMFRYYFL